MSVCVCVCAMMQPPGPSSRSYYNPPTISLSFIKEPYFHHIRDINVSHEGPLCHAKEPHFSDIGALYLIAPPPRQPILSAAKKLFALQKNPRSLAKEPCFSQKRALHLNSTIFLAKKPPLSLTKEFYLHHKRHLYL